MSSSFDRVRARAPHAQTATAATQDNEGKRALFSSTTPEADLPGGPTGSVTVECRRCGERTALSAAAAVRAAFPSLLLSIGLGRGEKESTVGLLHVGDVVAHGLDDEVGHTL